MGGGCIGRLTWDDCETCENFVEKDGSWTEGDSIDIDIGRGEDVCFRDYKAKIN